MLQSQDILLKALHEGALVITPNNRLSKQLLKSFADKYIYTDSSLAKPLCMPYQNFLQYLYKEIQHHTPYIEHPVLLNNTQESYLWIKIFEKFNLPNINRNLIKQIQEAWMRCRLWQVDINDLSFLDTFQGKISQDLQKEFQKYLQKNNVITQANLINHIVKYPTINNKKIIWACFDDYTPAQILLQNHLQKNINTILHYDLQNTQATSLKYRADDIHNEYSAMLTWIISRLNAGDNNIAIVMPNIETHGKYVANLIQKKLPKEPINISLGQSLSKYLLVAHALSFIFLEDKINNCDARLILNSPYLGGSQTEFIRRAELLQNLKILKFNTIKIKELADECHKIAPQLTELLSGIKAYPNEASPHEWARLFQERLHDLGFPGEYGLSSETYQCFKRLQNLFSEFIKISIICQKMPKKEAFDTLYFIAQENIFQPKQEQSKISILGLLEASGCIFDSIWVTNLTDKCLPGGTNFSAFIPIQMQKNLNMPHSSHDRELQFAKQQIIRLQSSCKNIIFSYPSFIDDIPMLPSPLLQDIKEISKFTHNLQTRQSKLAHYVQEYIIPVQTNNDLSGGTSLLANQAKCPFMAFAKNRLYAIPANPVDNWPNNLERGQILHKVLEEFWNKIINKQTLSMLTNEELDDLINKLCQKIINTNQPKIDTALHNLITDGELKRYNKLVKESLKWEMSRPNFKVIATEKTYTFNLDGITFNIRVDRLDESYSENSSKIIIDYKSTMPASKPWDEDRPLEPQLLLYALLDDTVNCILYLELKNGHVEANGVSAFLNETPGIKTIKDWQNAKITWRNQLTSLANEFKKGECSPNPAKASICQTCDLQSLCRFCYTQHT